MDILLAQRNSEDMFYALAQKIDEQPTTYDVDKIVGQLEKEKQINMSAKNEAIIRMCGASANFYSGKECAYQRAIKIVKVGGINEI